MTPHLIDIGKGEPIIFQHGLASSSNQIQTLLEDLSSHRLICIDCPGHGQSLLAENTNVSFKYYTDIIIAEMDRLEISEAIFGGLSMGAGIAIHAAIHFPDRVKAIILHRPAWLDKARPQNLDILSTALAYLDKSGRKELFEKTKQFEVLNKILPKAASSVLGVFSQDQQKDLSRVIKSMYLDAPFSSVSSLQNIEKPVLIMGNDNDPLHPFTIAEEIHNNLMQSKLFKLTSRYINAELHKQQVNNHISNFLKTLK